MPRMRWSARSDFPFRSPRAAASPDGVLPRAATSVRWLVLLVLLALVWAALLAWAAHGTPSAPFQPDRRLRSVGADFHPVVGAASVVGGTLQVTAAGADNATAQARALPQGIAADEFPLLRYRWRAFPSTRELSFMFRRADAPGDVRTLTLPPAGRYPAYFDLSSVPAWRGRIIEIGFAQYPTAQLVPYDLPLRPFALAEAELWSTSWRGSLGALGTDWLAYRPWALMSISALGPDAPWPHKISPVVVLALGLATSLLLAGVVLRLARRTFAVAACVALAAGWVVLDLRWLADFAERNALTRELYAGKPWHERARIEPDAGLVAAAGRVREVLKSEPAVRHVVVAADSSYTMLRLAYHLLPLNAAPASAASGMPAPGTVFVVHASSDWRFDPGHGVLRGKAGALAARRMLDEGDLQVYRLEGGAR